MPRVAMNILLMALLAIPLIAVGEEVIISPCITGSIHCDYGLYGQENLTLVPGSPFTHGRTRSIWANSYEDELWQDRGYLRFDTSGIPDDAIVTKVELFYDSSDYAWLYVEDWEIDWKVDFDFSLSETWNEFTLDRWSEGDEEDHTRQTHHWGPGGPTDAWIEITNSMPQFAFWDYLWVEMISQTIVMYAPGGDRNCTCPMISWFEVLTSRCKLKVTYVPAGSADKGAANESTTWGAVKTVFDE